MTAILIPREPAPFDVTADQVVAYLLRKGYVEDAPSERHRSFSMRPYAFPVEVPSREFHGAGAMLSIAIERIADREYRPAEAVAEDIAGPVRGTVGVVCAVGMDGPWLWGGCRRTEKCNRVAPRAPEVK